MSSVPSDLTSTFEEAGWRHDRQVSVDERVPLDHPARLLLGELGGLRLMRFYGDYEICEVDFQYVPDKDELAEAWEAALGVTLIGIAERHNGHGELLLSDTGQVFSSSYMHDAFSYVGGTFQEAVRNLITGKRDRPMLLETDTSVMLYGHEYMHDDPEVMHPSSPEFRPV